MSAVEQTDIYRQNHLEANLFAMHLLVPSNLLREEMGDEFYLDLCDDSRVANMAKRFGVSFTVMLLRILEEKRGFRL